MNLHLDVKAGGAPEVGDMKVSHVEVLPVGVTVLARLRSGRLEPFSVDGQSMTRVDVGSFSLDELASKSGAEQSMLTWLLRLGGFAAMWLGLVLLCGPVVRLADIVPFFGSFVGFSVNTICGLLAFLLSLVIIAVSWLAHRPLVSVAILAALAAATYFMRGERIAPSVLGGGAGGGAGGGGGGGSGGLAPCLRDCAALKDDSALFDVCTGACVKKYA